MQIMGRSSWAKACSACFFHAEMDSRLSLVAHLVLFMVSKIWVVL